MMTTMRASLATALLMTCGSLATGLVAQSATAAPRYAVNLVVSDTTPAVGQLVRFSGKVRPSAPGRRVKLQGRTVGTGWVTLRRPVLSNGSTYKTFIRFNHKGRIAIRVVKPASRRVAQGISRTRHLVVGQADPGPMIVTAALPPGVVGSPYSATVETADSRPGFFQVVQGTLPPGLGIDDQDGEISGTPTAEGSYDFTVLFRDPDGRRASRAYTIAVAPPAPA